MKNNFLIVSIIFCSFVSGILGAQVSNIFLSPTSGIATSGEITKNIDTKIINLENFESEVTTVVESIAPSVVSIVINKDLPVYRNDPWGFFQNPVGSVSRKIGGGSGFFVSRDGKIMTNRHVVQDQNADYTVILSDGEEFDAEVLALDPINDLAVIQILEAGRDFPVLQVQQDTEEINIGQFAIAVGNALAEFQNSVSLGIVSGKNRAIEAEGDSLSGLLQTDAAINPGNSGGPLVNLAGSVIGINTAIAAGSTGVGFAFELSQKRVDYILQSIQDSGRIKRPFIGINYTEITPQIAQELGIDNQYGAYIFNQAGSVVEGSSAEKNGLEPGDIILEVNDMKVEGGLLTRIIQNSLPGDILELKIQKKSGEEETIQLELGEY